VIVADASAVVEVLLNTSSGLEIRRRFGVEDEIDVPLLDAPLITRVRAFASIKGHRARILLL
jgi:hypothetical protein